MPPWKRSSARERLASHRQRVENWRPGEYGLLQNFSHGFWLQEAKDVSQGKAVLLGERDVEAVIGGSRLEFEIETAAETFAQGQSPGLVDACAKRRMNDELHAAAFIEEALRDDRLLGGYGAQHGAAVQDMLQICSAPGRRARIPV